MARYETSVAERRVHPRHALWFPVQVDGEELGVGVGITRDASATGLALDANMRFSIGAPVRLTFRVRSDDDPLEVDATVVRCARERTGEWPWRVAVEFDDPMADIEPSLRREALEQAHAER